MFYAFIYTINSWSVMIRFVDIVGVVFLSVLHVHIFMQLKGKFAEDFHLIHNNKSEYAYIP
jgi:hypothetical protein